jgi:D-alanyl-D-alanine carboxypeptidase (penicillin-binding protein 5/6)
MVVLDHLGPNEVVRVATAATAVQPSKLHIAAGERFYVRDLVQAMLLCSANDAAYALAIATSGTVRAFSSRMNAKARSIGARHSHFVSPAGLPAQGQYSTAYDLAKITAAAQKYPLIVQTLRKRSATIKSINGRTFALRNTNKMLWNSGGREILGKTGYTRMAKHCFAGRIRVSNRDMLVGLMGAPKRADLWLDLKKLAAFPPSITKPQKKNPILINRKLNNRTKVKKIQTALKRAGYFKGPVTGNFGPMTLSATKKFQAANGLQADGVVGKLTWTKLKGYL